MVLVPTFLGFSFKCQKRIVVTNSLKAGSGADKIYGCLVYRHSRAADPERDLMHAEGHC